MKHSLKSTGLSLSQAQSISNLCYQRALDITNKLSNLNNASKSIKVDKELYTIEPRKKLPENVVDLLTEKAKLHAVQAFLVTNIKAKDELLDSIRMRKFTTDLLYPETPEYKRYTAKSQVGEMWGWEQLTIPEYNEYLEAEAFAAHIGQFIHKNGELDKLRKDLPNVRKLEWMELETGKKTPITVVVHHSSDELLAQHEMLAALHRKYEQRVNYFKAKVKNLVTEENARIARENADIQADMTAINNVLRNEHNKAVELYEEEYQRQAQLFQAEIEKDIQEAAKYRILVDSRYQPVVDMFLAQLPE